MRKFMILIPFYLLQLALLFPAVALAGDFFNEHIQAIEGSSEFVEGFMAKSKAQERIAKMRTELIEAGIPLDTVDQLVKEEEVGAIQLLKKAQKYGREIEQNRLKCEQQKLLNQMNWDQFIANPYQKLDIASENQPAADPYAFQDQFGMKDLIQFIINHNRDAEAEQLDLEKQNILLGDEGSLSEEFQVAMQIFKALMRDELHLLNIEGLRVAKTLNHKSQIKYANGSIAAEEGLSGTWIVRYPEQSIAARKQLNGGWEVFFPDHSMAARQNSSGKWEIKFANGGIAARQNAFGSWNVFYMNGSEAVKPNIAEAKKWKFLK